MEIVEHVSDINLFISQTSKLLKKDGIMFIATINKTLKSYIFAIIGAEYILRWLPIGTHNWEKFVEPEILKKIAENNSLYFKKLTGVKFSPVSNNWKLSTDSDVNYIMELKKN